MAGNPRLDDLRKRLEKEPGSRLFAQLAEELRKEGELEEAIQVAREGLKKHPNYPSARMTLGRALLDTGDLAAAKTEFEVVLKGAPDNILASRYLAECLEGLGDLEGATGRYKLTLQLAPGDKHAATRLQAVEEQLRATGSFKPLPSTPPAMGRTGGAAAAAAAAPAPAAPPSAAATATAAPLVAAAPVAVEPPAAEAEAEPAPIKLVEAEEEFELERPYEAGAAPPTAGPATTAAAAEAPAPEPARSAPPEGPGEFEFDLGSAPTIPFQVTPVDEGGEPQEMAEATAPEPPAAPAPEPPAAAAEAPPAVDAGVGAELVSSTLAELYFKQGHVDKAREVYRQLVEREPTNDRVRQRFAELSDLEQRAASPAPPPGPPSPAAAPPAPEVAPAPPFESPAPKAAAPAAVGDDRAARRQALERTIARLEGFLSAIKRSAP